MRTNHLTAVVFTIVFFMCVALYADTLRIPCHFEMPAISEVDGSHLIRMEGLTVLGTTGEPLLPVKTLTVLLPYGQSLSKVWLEIDKQSTLPGTYEIQYQKEVRPIGLPPAGKNLRNEEIYRSSSPYPKEPVHVLGEQTIRGHRVAIVNVCPVRYVPASGRITIITKAHLAIKTQNRSVSIQERKSLRMLPKRIRLENSQALSTYPVQSEDRGGTAEYLLITSSRLLPSFLPLLEWKELKGLHCKTALVEEIEATGTGLDLPQKIRNYIRDCYLSEGTQYVLLGGDDEIIPAKGVFGQVGNYLDHSMPCDLYYTALDGNWNSDGDSVYGEPNDGVGGGEVDLLAEVLIGRAPVGTSEEVTNFVRKTLQYEQYGIPNLDAMVWIGEQLDAQTFGSDSKEAIAVQMPPGYSHVRLYDRDNSFTTANVLAALNASPHIINHLGHSDETYCLGLEMHQVLGLTNAYPFLVYSQGCYAGAFDTATSGTDDCIGEKIVTMANGAFAGIFNSRYGWYTPADPTAGPSHYFDQEFFDALFAEGQTDVSLTHLGAAFQDAKEDLIGTLDEPVMRWCYMNLVLFGDPEMTVYNSLHKGTISFDSRKYKSSASPLIRLVDYDLNADHSSPDTVVVPVASDTDVIGQMITLTEVGPNTGLFSGRLGLSLNPATQDGILQVKHGDTISVLYVDQDDGSGASREVRAAAQIDDVPPVVSNICANAIKDTSARISWQTDELADARVEYGLTPALGSFVGSADLSTDHVLRVNDLQPDNLYYYAVESRDEAGNVSKVCLDTMQFQTRLATTLFFDDIEPGGAAAKGMWTSQVLAGDIPLWTRTKLGFHSKHFAWHVDDYPRPSACVLDTPEVNLKGIPIPQLVFWHRMVSEKNYDGGYIQVSVDRGKTWHTLAESRMVQGTSYKKLGATCPTANARGWTGNIAWERVIFDLEDFAGKRVIIRFRMESDNSVDAGQNDGWLIDDVAITSVHGLICFDRPAYRPGDTVYISVFEGGANRQHARSDTPSLVASSLAESYPEPVRMSNQRLPGGFVGAINLAEGLPTPDGVLQVRREDVITAAYTAGRKVYRETANVDGLSPSIYNVRVTGRTPDSVTLEWETNEPTDGLVMYGPSPQLGLEYYSAEYTTRHVTTVRGLERTTIYYFKLMCTDKAGNISLYDKQGNPDTFVSGGFELSGKITEDMTLYAIPGNPWIFTDDTKIQAGVKVTVEPGAVLKFGKGGKPYNNASLWVYGSLIAVGTPEKPITFTSIRDDSVDGDTNGDGDMTRPTSGDWGTVSFSDSSADSSIIENAVFKYGRWDGGQECGVVESRTPTPTIKNCRFEKNVFPVAFTLGAQPELSGLKLASNDFNGLWLRPGLQLKSGTLNVTEVPYIFWSPDGRDFILPSSSSLSVTPGVVIKVGSRANLGSTTSLVLSGTVNISGTADKPVVLTSLKDDSIYGDTNGDGTSTTAQPGDWGRISLSNTSAAVEHCIIR
ncbi:MAG: hypothetical protein K6U00_00180, partial [Armatimonadetes bacterium]|nr:hypothetical protein [Armatimonadota bacterium]